MQQICLYPFAYGIYMFIQVKITMCGYICIYIYIHVLTVHMHVYTCICMHDIRTYGSYMYVQYQNCTYMYINFRKYMYMYESAM